jgi:small conductance mechanosensitive channel
VNNSALFGIAGDIGRSVLDWLQVNAPTLIAVIVISWFLFHFTNIIISRSVKRIVRKTRYNHMTADDVKKRQKTLGGLLNALARIFISVVSFMIIFKLVFPHVNYTPLFASAGIVGLAITFGAQSLIKDFLTGIFIISENQYRVGDIVDIEGAAGVVEKVGLRSTVLRDAEGNVHYMPNGNIAHVINKTMGYSKVNFTISVKPDTDVDLLAKVINETGKALAAEEKWAPKILEAPSFLNIGTFSEIGMDFESIGF